MLRLKIYTRYDAKSSIFLDIYRVESQNYEEVWNELLPLFDDKHWERLGKDKKLMKNIRSLQVQKDRLLPKAVTFGAMCFEAFIYDYAAHYLSDSYVKRYIDKLDLISKWVIVPKLVLGKDFPRNSKAFEYVVKLVRYRNELVHAKSMPMPKSDDPDEFMKEIQPKVIKDVERDKHFDKVSPYKMVIEVFRELRKLEGDDIATQWWQLEEVDGSDIYFPEPKNK